jgi:hypothetical protein
MLTTKEFIEKVEELGYRVGLKEPTTDPRFIILNYGRLIADVLKEQVNKLNTIKGCDIPSDLMEILVNYAQTPIDKREKKGYLWIKNVRHYKGYSLDYYPNTNELKIDYDGSYDFSLAVNAVEYTESKKEEIEKKTGVPLVFIEE